MVQPNEAAPGQRADSAIERAEESNSALRLIFFAAAVAATYMFWASGFAKAAHFGETLGEMAHFGLQPPWLFAAGTIALQLAGSALVVLGGRFAWLGAVPLALFTLATIPLAHDFWNLPPQAAFGERLIAEEHVSVVGGLLLAALLGSKYGPQWRSRPHGI